MNIGLNLLFVAITGFSTVRYAFSVSPNPSLVALMIAITLFGIGGLWLGIRAKRR